MMHWIRSTILLLLLALAVPQLACNSTGSRQDDIDDATQYFALLSQTLVQFFQNDLNRCSNFQKIYDQISTDFFDCDNGSEGKFNLIKNNSTCIDGSPLQATANFTIVMENCDDSPNDVVTTGPLNFVLNFTQVENFVLVTSEGVNVNGLNFFFSDLTVEIKFSSGNLDCEGTLTVDDEECDVKSNCESCD